MAGEPFDDDLRRVVRDYASTEPPIALEQWIDQLPTRVKSHDRRLLTALRPLGVVAALVVVAVLGGILLVESGQMGSSLLPSGQPLSIVTEPTTYPGGACRLSLRHGVRMTRSGSELVFWQGDQRLAIAWPQGTKALLVDGRAELFAPDGTLIAVEGQILPDLGGGLDAEDRFHVCAIAGHDYP